MCASTLLTVLKNFTLDTFSVSFLVAWGLLARKISKRRKKLLTVDSCMMRGKQRVGVFSCMDFFKISAHFLL